ncbi:MAG: chromosomal replication initiator protein DnaA [Methanobrevibacter sp.]|nr:chromosomal replication initiator protein DnaA [Candidatus Saccharibacteria bacterium]MBQ3642577.1 chromosomal replication initiator protein DnaA [bacterium]MBQ6350921.1 chromosomal replication initiator protein DnaA [Methanobrevibacter sp.]
MYDVWQNALAEIEQQISVANFSTWFQDTSLIAAEDGNIKIGVKNSFYVKQLRARYYDIIVNALKNNNTPVNNIEFEVVSTNKPKIKPREISTVQPIKTQIKTIRKNNHEIKSFSNGLNPKYTLDNFVIGSNNELAVAAAKSIINSPGDKYNPFFLYGGPGLGKTHLVQAIGNELLRNNPDCKILYTPISHFYSDFIDAIQNGKGKEFNLKFQKLDCLIIDDFQFIVNKEKSQEEFFNIFNDLYQLNKQIIVTSDRLPSQIKTVDERLSTRLTWAGAFDIQLPKFEDKCAILRAKAELQGAEIEPEAIEYIAENVNTNIRDLEGELSTILLMSEVRGLTPLELINNGSVSVNKTSKLRPVSAKQIVDKTAKYYNLSTKEMCGKSRVANIKNARQVTMFLLSKELNLSTNKIAAEVGVKDHTTVMHGIKKIEKDLKLNFILRDQIEEIKEKIYG